MDVQLLFHFILLLWLIQAAASQEEGGKCAETCGNVTIPSPFGIEPGCYTNSWFQVTCRETPDGQKPFITRINLELLGSFTSRDVIVNNSVTYLNCPNKGDNGARSVNLTGSPFFFPRRTNLFGSLGCGNFATIFSNQTDPIGGCLQPRCGDIASEFGGCYATIPENLTSYTASMKPFTMTKITNHGKEDYSKRCTSAFMFDVGIFGRDLAFPLDINLDTTHVPATLEWIPFNSDLEDSVGLSKSACRERCGNVEIEYPFGIEAGCYMNDWFRVTCKQTTDGPKLFISSITMQILSISFSEGRVVVNNPITYFNCGNQVRNKSGISVNLTGSPFFFSNMFNRFGSVGCGSSVTIFRDPTDYPIGGCLQPSCSNISVSSNDMCFTSIPPGLSAFAANMTEIYPSNDRERSCGSAFLFDLSLLDSRGLTVPDSQRHVPTSLQWGKPLPAPCKLSEGSKTFCSSKGNYCWTSLSPRFLCVCSDGDSSNSFSIDVCEEPGKCEKSKLRYCNMLCLNAPGNYCSLPCPPGYEYSNVEYSCKLKKTSSSALADKTRNLVIIIGCSTSIGTILMLIGIWYIYKVLKRRRNIKQKQNNFKRNGGLLLQQQLSSNEGNVEKIRLFASKDLEKATDYYNESRILGHGGQGTVYKGMLTDGSIVAIKKSNMVEEKNVDEKKLKQFINEVIILSQINHRNVVKLLGCCLETKVPLLVYEFIPNGTLSQLIHEPNEEFPLTWEMRLRIAIEIANALSYLHSAASFPIYHRDIKSSNILLDDKYRAKVSDFGTSKSIALEQTHLTTRVQGTFGYLDPEYFRSNQFTEKSDVYSFGVVLVELLTGQKPVSSRQSEEIVRSLVTFFLHSMKENSLFLILDQMVMNDGPKEEIVAVAKLAKRCLNLNRKKRPTMRQVALELEWIRSSEEANAIQQSANEDSDIDDMIDPSASVPCSTSSSILKDSITLTLDS